MDSSRSAGRKAIALHSSTRSTTAWKLVAAAVALLASAQVGAAITCARTLTADVIALDQPIMFNRLGASNVNGMMYALRRDVVNKSTLAPIGTGGTAGNVMLRPDKRPRPLILRVAAGDCLDVKLTNLLASAANPNNAMPTHVPPFTCLRFDPANPATPKVQCINEQVADRHVGFHVTGMQLRTGIVDDSSMVGRVVADPGSLVPVGANKTYRLFAEKEGVVVNSERRLQRAARALSPRRGAKADWEIFQSVAQKMGAKWNYRTAEDVFREIARLVPG